MMQNKVNVNSHWSQKEELFINLAGKVLHKVTVLLIFQQNFRILVSLSQILTCISFYLIQNNYLVIIFKQEGFPCGSAGKESTCNVGYLGLIPRLGRSSGEGKGYTLQYSGLENSMDCIVHGITKSQTRLSNFHFTSGG